MEKRNSFGGAELWAIILICLTNLFIFADQNLMAPNLTQIARDFGFDDLQRDTLLGGRIAFGFWVIGGIVTLLIGYLTDKMSRKRLFVSIALLGMLSSLMTAFAQNYEQLFLCRALTGISLGGSIPVTFSLVGDYFSPQNRAKAVGFVLFANGMGVTLGQFLAGFTSAACLGPVCGWRVSFIIVSIPCMIIALLFFFTVKEPVRGRTEESLKELIERGQAYTFKISWGEYRELFKIRSNLLLFLNTLVGVAPWSVFFVYLNDFFAQDKGYGVETATLVIMCIGAGVILGLIISGVMGDFFYRIHPRYLPAYFTVTTMAGIVPTLVLLNWPAQAQGRDPQFLLTGAVAFIMGIVISQASSPVKTILLNVNAPETRGSIFSLFNLVDDLGRGLGPVIVSLLIVVFGRQMAFNISVFFWVPTSIAAFFLIWTFPRDERALEALLARRAREM
jgi:predicted MFS family arabinose efflux permease